jgi:NitT/TauT family transport system permease protein
MKALVSFTVILLIWEVTASGFIPPVSQIFITFIDLSFNGIFINNVLVSLQRLSIGWISGMIVGTTLGIGLALNKHLKDFIMPVVSALFPIPKVALLPLFLVIFGLGEEGKIATIFIGSFFPSVITAFSCVMRTPISLYDGARSLGIDSTYGLVRLIIFPYNLPFIIQGFRTSISLSMTLLVSAEMLGAQAGLGYWIFMTGSDMIFDQMFAGLIYLSMIGLIANQIINRMKVTVCKWSLIEEDKKS